VKKHEVDWTTLTQCQTEAADGRYAQAMAGFIQWLAPEYAELKAAMPSWIREHREELGPIPGHPRTADIIASLLVGWDLFVRYAQACEALTADEKDQYWKRGCKALKSAAYTQREYQATQDPATQFLELLQAAITAGKAHVEGVDGCAPKNAMRWGWEPMNRRNWEVTTATENEYADPWQPTRERIGWLDGEHLYLEPAVAYAVAHDYGQRTNRPLSIQQATLGKRLRDADLLASTDPKRGKIPVRRSIEGRQRRVWHLRAGSFEDLGQE
jgi:hypothetical protein